MTFVTASNRIARGLRRLHRDSLGDLVQKILIIAAIALPILILLLLFRNEISEWFKKGKDDVMQQRDAQPNY